MNICLFSPEEDNSFLDLKDERAVHLIKILHKQKGDTFSAGIIGGKAGTASITEIKDGKLFYDFVPETDGKELFPLKMIIGFPRPIQLKRLLRDMAGLGVSEVHLTGTELGEKSYLSSDLATTDAGYKMLLDGTVQAASTHVPLLVKHNSLKECLEYFTKNDVTKPALLALDNVDAKNNLTDWLAENNPAETVAAIGNERGWSAKERKLLEDFGFIRLRMGSRVLRTETASTVAASLILSSMGALN